MLAFRRSSRKIVSPMTAHEKPQLTITCRVRPDDLPGVTALYEEFRGLEERARETHGDDDYAHRVRWHGEKMEAAMEVICILGKFTNNVAAIVTYEPHQFEIVRVARGDIQLPYQPPAEQVTA